jgi:hypothetical protein
MAFCLLLVVHIILTISMLGGSFKLFSKPLFSSKPKLKLTSDEFDIIQLGTIVSVAVVLGNQFKETKSEFKDLMKDSEKKNSELKADIKSFMIEAKKDSEKSDLEIKTLSTEIKSLSTDVTLFKTIITVITSTAVIISGLAALAKNL